MSDRTDNTSSVAKALESEDEEYISSIATLLGPKFSYPRAGVIRPGVMRLKKGCSKEEAALCEKMKEEGSTWDDIDKALGADQQGKSKLIPENVDYFTVHRNDCVNPRHADEIMKQYADPDGKLRSIPVWFPVNEWWNIIPHGLHCYGGSVGIRYRSSFKTVKNDLGKVVDMIRVCEYPLPVEKGKRIFGGRQWSERSCDPEACSEYQNGECKFGGVIQFFIPGISGLGIWVLPTTSWYSLLSIKSTLEVVRNITNGRIARLFVKNEDRAETFFVIKKIKQAVASIDIKTGQPVKREQYLIALNTQLDTMELVLNYDNPVLQGTKALSILNPNSTSDQIKQDKAVKDTKVEVPLNKTAEPKKEKVSENDPPKTKAAEEKAPVAKNEVLRKEEGEKTPDSSRDHETELKKELNRECIELRNKVVIEYKEYYEKIRSLFPKKMSVEDLDKLLTCLQIGIKAGVFNIPPATLTEKAKTIFNSPDEVMERFSTFFATEDEDDDLPF